MDKTPGLHTIYLTRLILGAVWMDGLARSLAKRPAIPVRFAFAACRALMQRSDGWHRQTHFSGDPGKPNLKHQLPFWSGGLKIRGWCPFIFYKIQGFKSKPPIGSYPITCV